MANATRSINQKDTELVRHIGELASSRTLNNEGYQDLAIGFARLAGKTGDITTAIELHRSARLCAMAADMPEIARIEGRRAEALTVAFNHGKDLKASATGPQTAEFEAALRKVSRFNPPAKALLRDGDDASQLAAGMAMMVNSDPAEKVVPMAVADMGIAGLFRRGGAPRQQV